MRTWDSLSKAERNAAIRKHSRWHDPVRARKNWEAHERSRAANERNRAVVTAAGLVHDWTDEKGHKIPKTVAGIQLHEALVVRVRTKYPQARLNYRRIAMRYKNIRALAERDRKQAEYDAYHAKAAKQRERDRIKREAAIKKERAAREKAHKAASIRQAKRNVKRLAKRIAYERKQISMWEGYIRGDTDYINRIEPKLDGWRGTSLHSAMVRNVNRTKERRAKRQARLDRDRRYLAAFERELRDNQKFLGGGRERAKPAKEDGALHLHTVTWARVGKFLKPNRSITRHTDIWVRPNGTGKLRVTSSRDYDGAYVKFAGFTVRLGRYRRDFYAANLTAKQVKTLAG